MRTVDGLCAFLLAAILECQTHYISSKQNGRRGWRTWTYGRYGPISCRTGGCADRYACRRQIRVTMSPVSRCLPDIRAVIDRDLDVYEDLWSRKDFQAIENNFFTEDALILHSGLPLQRGRAGWGQFLADLATEMKWNKLITAVDTIKVGTEDFVSTVLPFEITSAVPDGSSTFGKVYAIWKRMKNVYKIDIFAYTFDQ